MLKITLGMKFGKLTVLEKTDKRYKKNCIIYKCKCECGNIVYVSSHSLISGNTTSCGCKIKESMSSKAKKYIKNNYINDTRLDLINGNKLYKNNTTGIKGVYENKSGTYYASINFKKKRYYLGTFATKEEATEVRKAAETNLFGDFLKWYSSTKEESNK